MRMLPPAVLTALFGVVPTHRLHGGVALEGVHSAGAAHRRQNHTWVFAATARGGVTLSGQSGYFPPTINDGS